MEYGHSCIICKRPITWQFAICSHCEVEYGRTSREWPEWLAFLWREQVKERRRNKTILAREVTASDLTFTQQLLYHDEYLEELPV